MPFSIRSWRKQTQHFIHNLSLSDWLLAYCLFVLISLVIETNWFKPEVAEQFVQIAYAFLHGKLYFIPPALNTLDASLFAGKFYWPLGPFPALILMPFVSLFGLGFRQGYVQSLLLLIIFYLLFRIAKQITNETRIALWLSLGYMASSAFIGVAIAPWSWQFAQITATLFTLAALFEFFSSRRWLVIGLLIGIAVSTRLDLLLIIIFFAVMIITAPLSRQQRALQLVNLMLPIAGTFCILAVYNYLRFQNIFEQGYTFQLIASPLLRANRSYGLWSWQHIPANVYYFLFKGPEGIFIPKTKVMLYPFMRRDPWGMSILFTSPLFIWALKAPWSKKESLASLLTTALLALAIFGYYGIGIEQFGYRYALDFYPFLFLLLCYAVKRKMPVWLKTVIVLSFCFNLFMING